MTIPPQPPDPQFPDEPGIEIPPEVPEEVPPGREPDWRSPGSEEPPIRMPDDNPDVETEL